MTMMNISRLLVLLAIGLCFVWSSCGNAFPVKERKNNGPVSDKRKNYCDIIKEKQVDFTDQLALEFFDSGNLVALNNVLDELVSLKCYTKKETDSFRSELVSIYKLINPNFQSKRSFHSSDEEENNSDELI